MDICITSNNLSNNVWGNEAIEMGSNKRSIRYNRYEHFSKFIKAMYPDARKVLEVGCGAGDLSKLLTELGYEVTALDYIKYNNLDKQGIAFYEKEFTLDTDISEYDLVVGLHCCDATERVIRNCINNDKEFAVVVCEKHQGLENNNIKNRNQYIKYLKNISNRLKVTDLPIYEFIVNNYGTKTADYNVMIKATGRSGVAVYSIIELNSENFVSQMREIDSAQKREFKYFVFNSSVTVNWSNVKVGYMFDKAYANVDGRGYTLTVNAQNAPQDFQGLFYACYGLWTNTVIKLNAEYASGANSKTYLVGSFYEGGIENCVIWVNATAYDQSGKVVTQPSAQLIGYPSVKASYTNNLFVLSGGADTLINIFGAMSDGGPYLRNSAVIRDTDSHDMTPTFEEGGNKGFTNVIHYRTLSDFILGNGTKYERGVNGELTATLTVVKLKPIYEGWSSVWEISEDKVTLMGKIVFQSVETGDDFISDSDIK